VAPGGFGKTRLGAERLTELRGLGWYGALLTQTNTRDLAPGAYAMLVRGCQATSRTDPLATWKTDPLGLMAMAQSVGRRARSEALPTELA
jgi:hypothetical protein